MSEYQLLPFVGLIAATSLVANSYKPESDPNSLRKSALGDTPSDQIIRTDLDGDGDPDIIERWWSEKRLRWFDEDDNATNADFMGDGINDSMQVDNDGDGFYDGPFDVTVKWGDIDGNGLPDIQLFNQNPKIDQPELFVGSSLFYVAIDDDEVGRFSGLDWRIMDSVFAGYIGNVNWRPNYHGNSTFLKEHIAGWGIEDPSYNWENPFIFWDPDGDGASEMVMRVADEREFVGEGRNRIRYDGIAEEIWIAYDVDNDAARDNEKDYDFTLNFSHGSGIDYRDDTHEFPGIRIPDWVKPYYRMTSWREVETFRYLSRENAVETTYASDWKHVTFTFDEDDDCHRWERVELYYPGNPYATKAQKNSIMRHGQADSLGDRGEWDADNSGRGKLYLTAWDGKMHLLGAEKGIWAVDRNREYWGALHPNGLTSRKKATKVEEVVIYADRDKNGFIDFIRIDYDGEKPAEREVDFKALGIDDTAPVIEPDKLGWDGLYDTFREHTLIHWEFAMRLYRDAFRLGFTDPDLADLTLSTGTHEKYENAYWIRETIFRRLMDELPKNQHEAALRAYYSNDREGLVQLMTEVASNR